MNSRFDWREFTRLMRAVPQRSLPAKTAQDEIGRAKAEIMALTNKRRPQDIENAFTNLVTGAFKAINLYQTAPSSGTAMVGSDKLSQQLAATKMTSKQMNMTMQMQIKKQKHWHELTKSGASIPNQQQGFLLPE